MPITAFSVGTSRTINLGNFESLRVEASVTLDVEADAHSDLAQHRSEAQKFLRQLLEDTYNAQHAERKKVAK
jgi:hypothetical protein